jgi:hypothetical protein
MRRTDAELLQVENAMVRLRADFAARPKPRVAPIKPIHVTKLHLAVMALRSGVSVERLRPDLRAAWEAEQKERKND